MNQEGLISVIIPLYNNEKYIKQCILSANCLTEVGEIIVVDDCSSDDSLDIVKSLHLEKVRYIRLNENKGVSYARNTGLSLVSLPFVAFLDSDDYYLNNRFKNDIKALEDQKADGIYHAMGSLNQITQKENELITDLHFKGSPKDLHKALLGTIKRSGYFSLNATTFKTNFVKNFKFNTNIKFGEDTLFIIATAIEGKLIKGSMCNDRCVVRLHGNRTTNNLKHRFNSDRYKIYMELLSKYRSSSLLNRYEKSALLGYSYFFLLKNSPLHLKFFVFLYQFFKEIKIAFSMKFFKIFVKSLLKRDHP